MDMKEEKFSDSEETIKDTCPLIEQNHDLPASAEDPAQDLPECFEITYNEMKPDPESIPAASPVDSSIHDDEILQENAGVVPSVNHIEGDQLDRIDIEELIKNNDPSISYHKPAFIRNTKVWKTFDLINYKGVRQCFTKCSLCQEIVTFKMRTGSNSLNRHKCKNAQNQETSKPSPISITSQRVNSSGKRAASTRIQAKAAPVKIPTNSTQNPRVHMVMIPLLPKLLPKSVTDDLLEAQVKFLSNGMLSTNTLSDPNFLELAQQLLNVGFKFGKHRVQDFLSQSMVEDHVSDKCLKAKEVLKSEISDFSISHCVWRSKEQQFVTVYGYYLTDDFSFKTVVLGTKVCTNLSSVLPIVERLVAEFKTQSDEENSVIKIKCVGTNLIHNDMNTSVKNHPCIIQLITKLIHTVYLESVESIKTLLHSFNHVHPLGEFPATSKDTMRHLIFLQEFIIVGDHECNVQLVKNLKTLKTLFGPLMDSIERLGQEKRASASEVFLWYQKFIKYYSKLFEQASEEDENVDWMNEVRIKLLDMIQIQYLEHIKDFYGVAVFLDPNFKSLKFLDFSERTALLALVKGELKKLTVNVNPPNPKKIKLNTFLEFMDISMGDEEDLTNSEIQRYLGLNLESSVNTMDFWNSADDLPNLKKLARKTLHVPACSFYCGCCFLSLRGEEKCKCNLRAEETESYTFLNHNV